MNNITKLLLILLSSFALSVASIQNVFADGLYVGAGVYTVEIEDDIIDDDDTVPAFFVGYNFYDGNLFMLSVEAGYYDLGEASEGSIDIEAEAITLAGVVYFPITPIFEIYGKVGVAEVDVEIETPFGDFDDDGSESFVGAGVAFDILDTIDIYAEYLVIDTEIDSELIGVGVRLDF